jgi:hypothetical protein
MRRSSGRQPAEKAGVQKEKDAKKQRKAAASSAEKAGVQKEEDAKKPVMATGAPSRVLAGR